MKNIEITVFYTPGIKLHIRDGVKLRGYIGNVFKEYSPLLHNHFEDGKLRYEYPLVQYKVLNGIPYIIGLNDGAALLRGLFLNITEFDIDGVKYPIFERTIGSKDTEIGVDSNLYTYRFDTGWMALNEKNFQIYKSLHSREEKQALLQRTLIGNIISFFKYMNYTETERILATTYVEEHLSKFKDQKMLIFSGGFTTNVKLPSLIGLGKAVSRGFGSIYLAQGETPFV